ncbi:DUF4129 domain-containing protein [Solitalea sp. MAHUQ-68]|uniref:DUF4129 domain-containing protein n=1 Tax=Solitalea agri TaxID=2953739 RepID=A0A9X2F6M9_9SPHI|nr:DUF4129 domain-containing protein [Solitalea agri]MCO4292893.1 DUF4129 domain-containing protein [Solitalea agri]
MQTSKLFALSATCANDTSKLVKRLPSKANVEKFASDPDFQYKHNTVPPVDWWGKFWYWVSKWLGKLFGGLGYDNFWQFVFIAIIVGVAIWVIFKLIGVKITDIFQRKNAGIDLPYETINEDVRKMDFEQLITEALEQKNFRLAVRLYYLKVLRELDERELISWKPEKTNRNYINELSAKDLKADFQQITLCFEYVWYGEFKVAEQEFATIRGAFAAFHKQIGGK